MCIVGREIFNNIVLFDIPELRGPQRQTGVIFFERVCFLQLGKEVFCRSQIVLFNLQSAVQKWCFHYTSVQAECHRIILRGTHLVSRSYHQCRLVTADAQAEIFRGHVEQLHPVDFRKQFVGCLGDIGVPGHGCCRHPDLTEILIVTPVSKPASHLHQCVIHLGIPIEVADAQPFQREAAGEAQPAHCNEAQSFVIFIIIQVFGSIASIDGSNFHSGHGCVQSFLNVRPLKVNGFHRSIIFVPGFAQQPERIILHSLFARAIVISDLPQHGSDQLIHLTCDSFLYCNETGNIDHHRPMRFDISPQIPHCIS